MPTIKQMIQGVVALLLLAVFLYIAAHLLVVAIFIGIGAVAIFAVRRMLVEYGILSKPKTSSMNEADEASGAADVEVTVIETEYKDVSDDKK